MENRMPSSKTSPSPNASPKTSVDKKQIRDSLIRLTAHASRELLTKKPHWGDAILCDGLLHAARALKTESPVEHAIKWFAPKLSSGPNTDGWFWFWAAEALPALDLHVKTAKREYLEYARTIIDAVQHKATHTSDGVPVPHPPAIEVWVDVAYFAAPAMALIGRLEKNPSMIEAGFDQVLLHAQHLRDPVTGLLWHVAYPESKTHSPCLWARGNSWFSIAASQVMEEAKAAGVEARLSAKLDNLGIELADQLNGISSLQDRETGLWHTVMERPESYQEASASAGFALALGRSLELNLEKLNSFRAENAYARALAGICAKINDQGEFTGVSQQTPPGDFAHYQSIEVGTAPFGTGVCMMALSEAL
jgi:rhamnogalacturonyl hydrolase YesR